MPILLCKMPRKMQGELMDSPDLQPSTHESALRGLRRLNLISRSAAILVPPVLRAARLVYPQRLRVLDVACGGGDVTVALDRTLRRRGVDAEVCGCDMSPTATGFARRHAEARSEKTRFFVHNALRDGIPSGFDVVLSCLFFHHLNDDEALVVAQGMCSSARRAVVISDLERCAGGMLAAVVACRLLTRSPVVHVDGPRSVAAAFTPSELLGLADRAGLGGSRVTRHWPFRIRLAWERP